MFVPDHAAPQLLMVHHGSWIVHSSSLPALPWPLLSWFHQTLGVYRTDGCGLELCFLHELSMACRTSANTGGTSCMPWSHGAVW